MTARVVLYARVSTEEQSEEGHSIDAQLRLMREFCARKNWQIVGEFVDAGISGTTVYRPEFQKMLRSAKKQNFDIIVVHKLDRFSRSLVDTLITLSELSRDGISFCSASEDFDFTTPIGKVLLALLAAFAQYFIDNLKAETKKGKKERALKGFYNGVVPFGYQAVRKEVGGIPIPHAENASAYREIIRRFAEGQSAREIAEWLNTSGFRTTGNRGINLFSPDAVLDIARNRFHLGEVSYKGVWRAGKHTALADADMWNRAQALIRSRATNREGTKTSDRAYPLRKLVYCAECGRVLRGQALHKKRYYRDMNTAARRCTQTQHVNAETLELQLGAYLAQIRMPEDWHTQILSRFAANIDATRIAAERRALTNELARARKLYIAGDLEDDAYKSERERINARLQVLQPVEIPDMERAAQLLTNIGALWHDATAVEQLNLAKSLFEKIWIRDGAIVALEPRTAFYALFEILEKEKPPSNDDGSLMSRTGATGVGRSPAIKHAASVIVILRPGFAFAEGADAN